MHVGVVALVSHCDKHSTCTLALQHAVITSGSSSIQIMHVAATGLREVSAPVSASPASACSHRPLHVSRFFCNVVFQKSQ